MHLLHQRPCEASNLHILYISTRQFLPCNFHKSYPAFDAFVCATTVCHLSLKSVSLLTRKGPNAQHHDNDNENSAPTCFKQANISKLDVCGRMLPQPFPPATCRRINSYQFSTCHSIFYCIYMYSTCILHVYIVSTAWPRRPSIHVPSCTRSQVVSHA